MRSATGLSVLLLLVVALPCCLAGTYRQNFNGRMVGWTMYNAAARDATKTFLQVNPQESYVEGQAWWASMLPCRSFTANFQFRLSRIAADGMTFGWVSQISPELGESGSCLGAYYCGYSNHHVNGYDGYFVEVDTYAFIDESGVPVPHIALCRSYWGRMWEQVQYTPVSLSGGQWYDMRVKLEMADATTARVRVWYDASPNGAVNEALPPILDYSIPNYPMDHAYFGFTGGTGNSYEAHDIDNYRLTVPVGDGTIHAPEWVTISPQPVYDSTTLKARAYRAWDPDGLRLFDEYRWLRNEASTWVLRSTQSSLPGSMTTPAEQWRCDMRKWNGFTYSTWCSSPAVTIGGSGASTLTIAGASAGTRSGQSALTVTLSKAATVSASILNLAGRQVAVVSDQSCPAGISTLYWNGRTAGGTLAPAGQYLVRLRAYEPQGATASCMASVLR